MVEKFWPSQIPRHYNRDLTVLAFLSISTSYSLGEAKRDGSSEEHEFSLLLEASLSVASTPSMVVPAQGVAKNNGQLGTLHSTYRLGELV